MFGQMGPRIRLRGAGLYPGVAFRRGDLLHRYGEPSGPSWRCRHLHRELRLRGVGQIWWGWPWGIRFWDERPLLLQLAVGRLAVDYRDVPDGHPRLHGGDGRMGNLQRESNAFFLRLP